MKLIIEDDEGRKTAVPLVQDEMEITIGRQEDNVIRLTERNVSRKHARLTRKHSELFIEDLGSYCGVKVNGQRIQGSRKLSMTDIVQIGDYDIGFQEDKKAERAAADSKAAAVGNAPTQGQDQIPSERLSTSIIDIGDLKAYDNIPVVDIAIEQAPRIVVQSGDLKGREFACIRSVLTVGRDFENDIAIDHRSLSRSHCKFLRTPDGEWKVIDLGSSNGVKINGERYSVGTLTSGDTILIGRVKLSFLIPGQPAAASKKDRARDEASVVAAKHGAHRPSASSGRLIGLIAACAVLLLGAAGAGFYFVKDRSAAPTMAVAAVTSPPPPRLDADEDEANDRVFDAPAPAQARTPPAVVSAPTAASVPSTPAVVAADKSEAPDTDAEARQAFDKGKALLASGKFSEAVQPLQEAVDAELQGADALLDKATREAKAMDALASGQALFDEAKFEEARTELKDIPESSAQAEAAGELLTKIDAAVAKAEKAERPQAEDEQRANLAPSAPKSQSKKQKPRSPYGAAYDEIPEDKMQVLDSYLGEMCDKPEAAIPPLRRLIRENPDYGYAYVFLGSCYIESDEVEKGKKLYRDFLRRWPKHPDAPVVREALQD